MSARKICSSCGLSIIRDDGRIQRLKDDYVLNHHDPEEARWELEAMDPCCTAGHMEELEEMVESVTDDRRPVVERPEVHPLVSPVPLGVTRDKKA